MVCLLAHGADPTPLEGYEAVANIVKFAVTFLLIAAMSYPILAPLFTQSEAKQEPTAPNPASGESDELAPKQEPVGWLGFGVLLVLALGWWLTRASLVEVMTDEPTATEHEHQSIEGGQIAMWADFHAEVVRIESGEVRVFLTDSYSRPIAARYFDSEVQSIGKASDSKAPFIKTFPSLDGSHRFAKADRTQTGVRVKVSTPGWNVTLKFDFDGATGRRSLPIWCGTKSRPNLSRPGDL